MIVYKLNQCLYRALNGLLREAAKKCSAIKGGVKAMQLWKKNFLLNFFFPNAIKLEGSFHLKKILLLL